MESWRKKFQPSQFCYENWTSYCLVQWSHCTKGVNYLGVNYQNLVMGPFDLGNGLLFLLVFTTYFIEHKLAREKQAQPSQ